LFIADADEGLHRGTPAFRAEGWKSLGIFSFGNGCLGYEFG
jgi:hypothetical protein